MSEPLANPSTALVTGAASGIGAALVEALLARGTHVVATDVDLGRLEANAWAARVTCRALDVTDAEAVSHLIETLPGLDLCINNAGVLAGGAFESFDLASIDHVMNVNFRGVLHGTHAAYLRMLRAGRGRILNVASMAGLHPVPYSAAYAASKHAVVGLTLSLRAEAARHGVQVCVACPGRIDTAIYDRSADRGGYSYRSTILRTPGGAATPASTAAALLDGLDRDEAVIVYPREARWLARAYRLAPSVVTHGIARTMRPRGEP